VPDLLTVQDRPELKSVADDRGYRPTRVLHGRVVSALVKRVHAIPRRNQDTEHPLILSSPDSVSYERQRTISRSV
jgi:hypothetical protein